ncbi:MAG: phenylalanine--tRNA ligase subunit beta [Sodaliphilus pleomorphus]|uniref:phenylalanine--tRNA ligase subunit beta n=1 Tax=Sodaliphilus pleomorphus TaxID=2606626 RepID=UPI0023F06EC7|nr:phenylalanine--tRNA ligase subunit beta [Sodaliphilus pleomorphus]MCI5980544.1 phenylalanine--tRNA ligase subunit beta [Muribaculaceae bacterium]MDD7065961.1 phenylalanine--tRNA ligase subunit beta [Sodaliphilus pleomorphus]MDY2832335.1 phenylalanine--tRNA ligase subunit beta [Sodaliphilus pleomorphus]
MNVSYKWLKEYIDFDLTPQQVSDALTSLGLEVDALEEVETIKGGLKGLVVGKVLTCEPHPNSDHMHTTTVDLGNGQAPVQIVCGAPNVAAGQKVIVATIGTKLYDGDQEFVIKKSKLRGVESYGMICAEDEIGVGTDHNGIIVLPDDAQVGMPAAQYYGVESDWLIEVDLTPNRIDGASHYGVARDLSAWMKRHGMATRLHRPSVEAFKIDRRDGGIPVEVENAEACPRYCGLTVRNVKVGESPKWLKDYLSAVGQRPINNIVDITNYILLGTGQPMHCFDLSKVKGDKIVVKTVKEGTKFVTLDGVERTLTDRDLMICNAEEPMCIGGVFGGLDSGVTEATTDIFLESAYFHPTWIRKSARRFGLNTDASFRFERGIDPNDTIYNLKLAALLVKQLAGGETCGEIVDVKAHDFPPFPVELRYDYVTGLIGKNIGHDTIKSIVESLEMKVVAEDAERLSLEVPTYRVDVRRPCDVVEDILRVYGYNNVEFTDEIHGCLSNKDDADLRNDLRELISNQLTSEGYNEIMNNSLTAASYYEGLESYPVEHCVRVINALSSDLNVMRQTLLFGGLESLARNINRKNANLRMYEFGDVYSYDATADNSQVALAPYSEHTALGMWLTGNNHDDSWADKVRPLSVYDLKAAVAGVMRRLGITRRELVVETMSNDLLDPALVYKNRGGKLLGVLGVVDEAVASKFDVDQPVYFAQFNWNLLCKLSSKKEVKYTDLPKTLPLRRDLALLVDKSVTYAQIEHVVEQSERKLLKSMTLFDVYEGKNLEPGKKSYAISMVLQDDQKTLNDHQIEAVMKKIVANLEKQLGAQLR